MQFPNSAWAESCARKFTEVKLGCLSGEKGNCVKALMVEKEKCNKELMFEKKMTVVGQSMSIVDNATAPSTTVVSAV